VNQLRGADAYSGRSFCIRADGTFTQEFRKPIPVLNPQWLAPNKGMPLLNNLDNPQQPAEDCDP
jgi:hypothetical protein